MLFTTIENRYIVYCREMGMDKGREIEGGGMRGLGTQREILAWRTEARKRENQMIDTELCAFGMVIREILRRRGIDTSSPEQIATEFASRGFEKRVGRKPERQNVRNWLDRGIRPDAKFGPWFCNEFVEDNQEETWVALTLLYPWKLPPDFPEQ